MLTSNVKENYYEMKWNEMLDFFIDILFICFFSRTGSEEMLCDCMEIQMVTISEEVTE
jgi:hypothetical protein